MFDQVLGLPVHALVVHAVVILGPLAALTAIAYAALPRTRRNLTFWLPALSLVTAATAYVAAESGERLEHRLEAAGLGPVQLQRIHDHVDTANLAKYACWAFFVIAWICVFGTIRAPREKSYVVTPRRSGLAVPSAIILVLAAAAVLYTVVTAGHSGAVAVWKPA